MPLLNNAISSYKNLFLPHTISSCMGRSREPSSFTNALTGPTPKPPLAIRILKRFLSTTSFLYNASLSSGLQNLGSIGTPYTLIFCSLMPTRFNSSFMSSLATTNKSVSSETQYVWSLKSVGIVIRRDFITPFLFREETTSLEKKCVETIMSGWVLRRYSANFPEFSLLSKVLAPFMRL